MEQSVSHHRLQALPKVAKWLYRQWKPFGASAVANIVLCLLSVGFGLASVWATKLCIDIATGVAHQGWTLLSSAVMLTTLYLVDVLLTFVYRIIGANLTVRVKNRLQAKVYDNILTSDWQVLHSYHSGDLLSRLQGDADSISSFLSDQLPRFVAALFQFAGAFVFLYIMDRRLAWVLLVVIPFMAICSRFYARKMRRFRHDVRQSESSVNVFLQETLQHSLVVKTLERIGLAGNRLADSHSSLLSIVRRNTRYQASAALLINITFIVGYLLAFFWGVNGLSKGTITFGAMIAFVQLVGQIQHPVRQLVGYVSVFVNITTAADRLMEIEQFQQEDDSTEDYSQCQASLSVQDISFHYKDASSAQDEQREVFSHWSGEFPKGSVTAVVGHTGAGKTTLISILLGLLRPQEGRVEAVVEGKGRVQLSRSTRSLFSYVPQGNTLLSGSIRENLLFGNPQATDEEMFAALHLADADFVMEEKQGLDTPCFERGGGLSEGQAQRVCIARALLKSAPILLLDEAFSSLDSDTAQRVLRNILSSRPNSTLIYITHRESLMPLADNVLRIG